MSRTTMRRSKYFGLACLILICASQAGPIGGDATQSIVRQGCSRVQQVLGLEQLHSKERLTPVVELASRLRSGVRIDDAAKDATLMDAAVGALEPGLPHDLVSN